MNSVVRTELESRVSGIKALPALPAVLMQLMDCLEQPANEIKVERVIELVSYDESVAAQCVRMTNSAMFGRRRQVDSVHDAVIALGLWRISDIVFSCTIPRVFLTIPAGMDPAVFWRHSLSSALISQKLARLVHSPAAEKAYLAGLLHDLGILVNATLFPDEFQRVLELVSEEHISIGEAEERVLHFTHAQCGRIVAEEWHFSEEIATVLEFHHDVSAAPMAQDLVALVHISDLLCHQMGIDYGFYERDLVAFASSPAWLLLTQSNTHRGRTDLDQVAEALREYAHEVVPIVNGILGQFAFTAAPRPNPNQQRPILRIPHHDETTTVAPEPRAASGPKTPAAPMIAPPQTPSASNGSHGTSNGASNGTSHNALPAAIQTLSAIDTAIMPVASDRTEKRSETQMRPRAEYFPYGFVRTSGTGAILRANSVLATMLGYSDENELVGADITHFYSDPAQREKVITEFRDRTSAKGREVDWKRKDGSAIAVRIAGETVFDADGEVEYNEGIVEDITDRRALEQQLRQAQKMEAIGRLAGGVAHDFNNLLGVITGYSELLLEHLDDKDLVRKHTGEIRKASDRAASLTHQLLAFSRQQVLETKILNLNMVVVEIADMLQRLLGEDVELKIALDSSLGHVKADRSQMEQVIMNLAVNARDAMPDGGKLTITSLNFTADLDFCGRHAPMLPGRYVALVITDSGTGMDERTKTRLFEPFFTTKETGKGTGLGLATVYGVIKQSCGFIWVDSELGSGATFRIYLPRFDDQPKASAVGEARPAVARGTETILLVEDEESLRTLTCTFLEGSGYKVLLASNGTHAVELARQHRGTIDLLLTDMVMPGMNGHAVAEVLMTQRPAMKLIYMSGYTGFSHHLTSDSEEIQLPKPFTRTTLLRKVREVLSPPASAGLAPS